MARNDRLIEKFRSCRGPFPLRELLRLLAHFGYEDKSSSGGSRLKFVHPDLGKGSIIKFHRPHPGDEIKYYLVKQVRETLQERGYL